MMKIALKMFLVVLLLLEVVPSAWAIETKVNIELKGWKEKLLYTGNNDYGKYRHIAAKEFDLEKTHGVVRLQLDLDKPILLQVGQYFNVFLVPGDDLAIHADVTKNNGGLKITFEGKGKENNLFLRELMNTYYHYFPTPLEMLYKPKLPIRTLVTQYDQAMSQMKNQLEKSANSIHPSLHKYLYTYLQLILPSQMLGLLHNNVSPDEKDLLQKYSVDLSRVKLYSEGYYEINFLPYISWSFKEFMQSGNKIQSDQELKKAIDQHIVSIEKLTDNKQVTEGVLYYFVSILGETLLKNKPFELQPYVSKFQETYPGFLAENLQKWYVSKLKIAPGKTPPAIDLLDIDGKKFSFDNYKGKVVYVDFWASWCGPCRYEMKKGAPALHHKFQNKEVVFVYVSIDEKEDAWKKAIQEDHIQGTHLVDLKGQVADIYYIKAVPHYLLIGKDGKIISEKAPRPTDPQTAKMIEDALQK